MAVLWFAEYANFKKNQSHRLSFISTPHATPEGNTSTTQEERSNCLTRCITNIRNSTSSSRNEQAGANPTSPLAARLSRPSLAAAKRRKAITNRALAYIIGYLLTYIFSFVYRVMEIQGLTPPFAIIFLTRPFYPMQGFFNVLIYSYPHVSNTRQRCPEYSWFRAFWEVVKSGGDNDQLPISRRSRRRASAAARRRLTFPLQNEEPNNPDYET